MQGPRPYIFNFYFLEKPFIQTEQQLTDLNYIHALNNIKTKNAQNNLYHRRVTWSAYIKLYIKTKKSTLFGTEAIQNSPKPEKFKSDSDLPGGNSISMDSFTRAKENYFFKCDQARSRRLQWGRTGRRFLGRYLWTDALLNRTRRPLDSNCFLFSDSK